MHRYGPADERATIKGPLGPNRIYRSESGQVRFVTIAVLAAFLYFDPGPDNNLTKAIVEGARQFPANLAGNYRDSHDFHFVCRA